MSRNNNSCCWKNKYIKALEELLKIKSEERNNLESNSKIKNLAYYAGQTLGKSSLENIKKITNDDSKEFIEADLILKDSILSDYLNYRIDYKDFNAHGLIPLKDFFNEWIKGIKQYGSNFNVDYIVKTFNGEDTTELPKIMKGEGINGMTPGSIMNYNTETKQTDIYVCAVKDIKLNGDNIEIRLLFPKTINPVKPRLPHDDMADELHTHIFEAQSSKYANDKLFEAKEKLELNNISMNFYIFVFIATALE